MINLGDEKETGAAEMIHQLTANRIKLKSIPGQIQDKTRFTVALKIQRYGKGPATKSDECLEKCQRGGSIFNPKTYVADFGNFKQGLLIMNLIQFSNFRIQGMFFQQLYLEKSKQDTL